MVTPKQQPESNQKLVTSLAPLADSLSKGVAAIAIALYACGFLIVSLHHSKYGFISANPFRPRVLAAGAWFLFFLAIPATAAIRLREFSWMTLARNLFLTWSFCLGLSILFSPLLFSLENITPPTRKSWWVVAAVSLIIAVGIVAVFWKKAPPTFVAVASVAVVVSFVTIELREMLIAHNFQRDSLTPWFLGIFVLTLMEIKVRSTRNLAEGGEWAKRLGVLFTALLVFAQYYYPHMKASWGGGTPVNVIVYFTKESAIRPGEAVSAQLVEESDEGFYIVSPQETRAIYVPRNTVALVYFSDKAADSRLLRDSK